MARLDDVKVRIGGEDKDVFTSSAQAEQHNSHELSVDSDEETIYDSSKNKHKSRNPGSVTSDTSDEDTAHHHTGSNKTVRYSRIHNETDNEDERQMYLLLHPRKKLRKEVVRLRTRTHRYCSCKLVSYVALSGVLLALMLVLGVLISYLTSHDRAVVIDGVSKCSSLKVTAVWSQGFPKLMTESSFRMFDIDNDGVLDVVFGFATGAESYSTPDYMCDIYFNGSRPCLGGVLAVNGRSGQPLWRHYTPHEIFALNCERDLNRDGVPDCLVGGRVATFQAVSGKDGSMIWQFSGRSKVEVMNLYTAQYLPDLNNDGVSEILNIHGGDPFGEPGSKTRLKGKLLIFSGRTGEVLRQVTVPDHKESYYSPVVYDRKGQLTVLFGTGGETHGGALWYIDLQDLYRGRIDQARKIYEDPFKGVMTPPVLIDMNNDGVADVMFASYNSTTLLVNGLNFQTIWNFTYPSSETYSTPSPGYYNNDDIIDFMVHWQYGPGFPVYYHSMTTVLDGKTGKSLISPPLVDTIGAQTSPITIRFQGQGNDVFLYWSADCLNHSDTSEFHFVEGTNVHEKSRSDMCHLRFNSEAVNRLYAVGQHIRKPGFVLYDSLEKKDFEKSAWINTTQEALEFLYRNPSHMRRYQEWKQWAEEYINSDSDKVDETPKDPKMNRITENAITNYLNSVVGDRYKSRLNHKARSRLPDIVSQDALFQDPDRRRGFLPQDYSWEDGTYEMPFNKPDLLRPLPPIRQPHRYGNDDTRSSRGRVKGGRQRVENPGRRWRRHVGPHDSGGLQRLISTGTLAPPLMSPTDQSFNHSMDVIFATYWFYPAKTKVIKMEDQECIENMMDRQLERFDPNSRYYGMDDDGYEHAVTDECLEKSGHKMPEHGVYESQGDHDPYIIHMGQLSLYRIRITCQCETTPTSTCPSVLPYEHQGWSGYMGQKADSHWNS